MGNCEKCGMEIPDGRTLCENCTEKTADVQPAAQPEQAGAA